MTGIPQLTLVLGGASSGKSRFAEDLVSTTGRPRIYVATAQAFDEEMAEKIAAHKDNRGPDWRTIETPLDPASALLSADENDIVLLDCATLWLSNLILAERDPERECRGLRDALAACTAPVVVVSNETGMGVVPEHALGRVFRNAQGRLNQDLAAQADRVAFVVAGLPIWLKGGP